MFKKSEFVFKNVEVLITAWCMCTGRRWTVPSAFVMVSGCAIVVAMVKKDNAPAYLLAKRVMGKLSAFLVLKDSGFCLSLFCH